MAGRVKDTNMAPCVRGDQEPGHRGTDALDRISSFREGRNPLAQQGVIHSDSAARGHQHIIAFVT